MTNPLAPLFAWTVPVRRKTGQNAATPIYGDWDTVQARVRMENTIVTDADGNEVVASATLSTFPETAAIPAGSKVTLPAEFGGSTLRVVSEGLSDMGVPGGPRFYRFNLA